MEIVTSGSANAYFVPDEMILYLHMTSEGITYEESLSKGMKTTNYLKRLLEEEKIEEEHLHLENLYVREEKKYEEKTNHEIGNVYIFEQNAKLKIDYDCQNFQKILSLVQKLEDSITIQLSFGLKNVEEAKKQLIPEAYRKAKENSQVIADTTEKKWIGPEKISLQDDGAIFSENTWTMASLKSYAENTITPSDIRVSVTLNAIFFAE